MQISFQANYICKASYQHRNIFSTKYKTKVSHIVKVQSNNDIVNISKIAKKWDSSLGILIADNAIMDMYNNGNSIDSDQYLVVTKQQKKFEELKPNLIMGLMQMHNDKDDNSCYVEYLQINPKTFAFNHNRKNKGFGKSLVEYLKTQYQKISLVSDSDAVKFYQKLGFQKLSKYDNKMVWVSK